MAVSARTRRRLSGYAAIVVSLAVIAGIYAMLAPRSRAQGDPSYDVSQGRQLYLTGCSSCHGLYAQGTQVAPTLIGVGAAAVDFQVSTGRMPLATHGVPEAARHPLEYTPQEIAQLAGYIASLAPGPGIPTDQQLNLSGANEQLGGALFRTNCAACHNFAGEGSPLTKGVFAPSLKNATPKQMYEAMLTGPEQMPNYPDTVLSPQEKASIIKYMQTLDKHYNIGGDAIGRIGPVPEGLAAFLLGIGSLIALMLWIGARA